MYDICEHPFQIKKNFLKRNLVLEMIITESKNDAAERKENGKP